jgi:hypothetical protein
MVINFFIYINYIMSGGYNPKVSNPWLSNSIPQMKSNELQKPFFFGGAQTPIALSLPVGSFSGSGFSRGTPSLTRPMDLDFTTKKGDKVYHKAGKDVKKIHMPFMKK